MRGAVRRIIFSRMPDRYAVSGGVGGRLPGVVGPDELDGRLEWTWPRPRRDLYDHVLARLGSEEDADRVILAVLGPLRGALAGAPLGALVAKLPLHLARELAEAERNLRAPLAAPPDGRAYVAEVSRLLLHPPEAALTYVRAVFAAAKAALAGDEASAIEAQLPAGVADAWRDAA